MDVDFVRRLKTHLGLEGTESTEEPVTDGGRGPRLFTCRDCDSTYISLDMDSCPECGNGVTVIPNGKDLGLA